MLPGLALLAVLWPAKQAHGAPLSALERLTLALCLSLIAAPLLLLLVSTLGLRWNAAATCLLLLACAGVSLWRTPRSSASGTRWALALFCALSIALLIARLYVVRELPAGLLGDSYHHTIITQLLVDHGGLFTSWEPYAPMNTFTYHFGFHANAAFTTG